MSKLREIVAAWNLTRVELARLATERQDDWRLATVRLRRKLHDQIAAINATMSGLDVSEQALGECEKFRRALSTVRSQLAVHQAQWPAVSIQPEDREYQASVVTLRRANDALAHAAAQLIHRVGNRP